MNEIAHKPDRDLADPKEILLGFLDYYRSVVARKLAGLSEADLRRAHLPSGWAPIELLKHLVHVERRWLRWGFLAEPVPDPHGDENDAGRWRVGTDETVADLLVALAAGGAATRRIAGEADLADLAHVGGRFTPGDAKPRPTLGWILAYVLQEYARHAGHLDVARELADGSTGE
jgi:hypothetical protein